MADRSWEEAMTQLAAVQCAFINGDATGIKELYSHRDDVTVFGGFGGYEHGWAEVGPRLDWAASQFKGGAYTQRDISATVGTDMACLVCLECWAQPDNILNLRVTQTFRREDGKWRLVHRHADELVGKRPPP